MTTKTVKKAVVKKEEIRQYECLYIIANDVKEEKRKELVEKFSKMTGNDAKIDNWGLRKFVTPINYKKDGYYVLMNFSSTSDVPRKIGDLMNITDGIVRFMFICKDEQLSRKSKAKKAKAKKSKDQGGKDE